MPGLSARVFLPSRASLELASFGLLGHREQQLRLRKNRSREIVFKKLDRLGHHRNENDRHVANYISQTLRDKNKKSCHPLFVFQSSPGRQRECCRERPGPALYESVSAKEGLETSGRPSRPWATHNGKDTAAGALADLSTNGAEVIGIAGHRRGLKFPRLLVSFDTEAARPR